MQSRASFKAHPLHPALIPFPFAFLTTAAAIDALVFVFDYHAMGPGIVSHALVVLGLASGLVAAIPGAIDYFYTVPPRSSGKQRATRHALGNVTALALFTLALVVGDGESPPNRSEMALELAGAAALIYAGWLGGTLVTRNLISVDHRYAGAGKWQEARIETDQKRPVIVGHADDLKTGQMKLLHVAGTRLVLAHTSKGYAAFADRCTHRGGSLAGGVLIGDTVQCLWHGSQFDCLSGEVNCGPAKRAIRVYSVEQSKDGKLSIASPPE
jgi:nitrite reductase/ring-hydroxylating ferredoxin subunit/uncharacterized membrane protein